MCYVASETGRGGKSPGERERQLLVIGKGQKKKKTRRISEQNHAGV